MQFPFYFSQQAYTLLENYTESVRGIKFNKGDVVEVLDTEKTEEWLVRKQNNKEEVKISLEIHLIHLV